MVVDARSAVIVPVAVPAAVERVRDEHVPVAAAGVPPHVTLLSPFVPAARLDGTTRDRLSLALAPIRPFEAGFAVIGRFPDALYLAPEPDAEFRRLIAAVCGAFPAYPPYAEATYRPEDVVPHLTIAIGDGSTFDDLASRLDSALPFTNRIDEVTVVAEGVDRRWYTRWTLPLRP